MTEAELLELRSALFGCIAHFRTLETVYRVLRLKLEVIDPSCLNAAEVNRLAAGLNCGPVIRVEEKAGGVCDVWINHPSAVCPAMFVVFKDGMIPTGISEYSRQTAESNLAAWLDMTAAAPLDPASGSKAPKSRRGPRSKNDELLDFDEAAREKNVNLTDKEVLERYRKKRPNHPIFEASDPAGSLRRTLTKEKEAAGRMT